MYSKLQDYYNSYLCKQHLKDLLSNEERNDKMVVNFDDILLDYSHEKIDEHMLSQFQCLADEAKLFERIEEMF